MPHPRWTYNNVCIFPGSTPFFTLSVPPNKPIGFPCVPFLNDQPSHVQNCRQLKHRERHHSSKRCIGQLFVLQDKWLRIRAGLIGASISSLAISSSVSERSESDDKNRSLKSYKRYSLGFSGKEVGWRRIPWFLFATNKFYVVFAFFGVLFWKGRWTFGRRIIFVFFQVWKAVSHCFYYYVWWDNSSNLFIVSITDRCIEEIFKYSYHVCN